MCNMSHEGIEISVKFRGELNMGYLLKLWGVKKLFFCMIALVINKYQIVLELR